MPRLQEAGIGLSISATAVGKPGILQRIGGDVLGGSSAIVVKTVGMAVLEWLHCFSIY